MAKQTRIRVEEPMVQGAVSCETGADWIKPWRLPFDALKLFPPEDGLVARAEMPAGVRLHIRTDSAVIELSVLPRAEARLFDLTIGGTLVRSHTLPANAECLRFADLPAGDKDVEIWLSHIHPVALRWLGLEPGASFALPRDTRPRWTTYGSSISHCGSAHSPSRTWPACVARSRGFNLTCLGFGGNCHIEPMIARVIRDLPADFISLKLGINVMGASSLSPRTFRPAIIGLVQILRETHADVPVALISPIVSPPREDTANAVGLSLRGMRREAEDAAERLRACGDTNLSYFSGLELFGAELVDAYLPDLLHPNGDGYEVLARNFEAVVLGHIPL